MGFISRLGSIFRRSKTTKKGATPRTGGLYQSSLFTQGTPLSVSTVYRCVNVLANGVANLPMRYKRQKGGIFVDDTNSSLSSLLMVQPCPYMSAVDFWKQVVRHILLNGNAYIVPVYNYALMEISALVLVDPSSVQHDTKNDTYKICDPLSGIEGEYDEEEIIHIKNFSIDGKRGLSTLTYARMAVDIALSGDRETLNRFDNGGNVRGIVSNDTSVRGFGEYQDSELEKTAADLDSKFSTGHRIVSLPGQAEFSPISLSSTDMQFLESRKFTVPEICRFFNVPPEMVFADSASNYKSAEQSNVNFLNTGLNPLLTAIENEFLRKLVAPSLWMKRKFEFDRTGIYASDLASRVKYQAATIANGIYTVNDWRRIENKEPVEGGDKVFVSANLKGIDESATEPDGPIKQESNDE